MLTNASSNEVVSTTASMPPTARSETACCAAVATSTSADARAATARERSVTGRAAGSALPPPTGPLARVTREVTGARSIAVTGADIMAAIVSFSEGRVACGSRAGLCARTDPSGDKTNSILVDNVAKICSEIFTVERTTACPQRTRSMVLRYHVTFCIHFFLGVKKNRRVAQAKIRTKFGSFRGTRRAELAQIVTVTAEMPIRRLFFGFPAIVKKQKNIAVPSYSPPMSAPNVLYLPPTVCIRKTAFCRWRRKSTSVFPTKRLGAFRRGEP